MPIITSRFRPRRYLRQGDVQSMIPALFRKRSVVSSELDILELPDGDFLSLEWLRSGNEKLAILSHGLEGSTQSSYMLGMARMLHSQGWDILMWNMRGCGSRPNRLLSWYHSGQSQDLAYVIDAAQRHHQGPIDLVGFSVGGNITLKYLGESGTKTPPCIRRAVVVSVPTDLRGCAETLARPRNSHYMEYLLRPVRRRLQEKAARFPGSFDLKGLARIRTFYDLDHRYTAPFHGFSSVDEYWDLASSLRVIDTISVPTLLMNAQDDPFLSDSCTPHAKARQHPYLYVEAPKHGGHVGFITSLQLRETWLERRVVEFLQ